jgi:hypothetical protein
MRWEAVARSRKGAAEVPEEEKEKKEEEKEEEKKPVSQEELGDRGATDPTR